MCGIAGWFGREPRLPEKRLAVMRSMTHRGPDGEGFYQNPGVAMYHTRLSIIDIAGGNQPLISEDGCLALVANGEIYNHVELREALEKEGARFQTGSDCEVILQGYARWGDAILNRLEGMYAFALHDASSNELLLARDPLGMKPLFFSRQPFGFGFASEIKSLLPFLPARPAVNPRALVQYLETQHSLGTETLFEGVERLAPGEALKLRAGIESRRWYHWRLEETRATEFQDPVRRLDELMEEVFTQHLRSDVPIGLFLSGGVDSTVILGLMRRYGLNNINTFSLGFPGSSVGDELTVAGQLALHFGTKHHVITPTPDILLKRFVETIWAADELMRDWASLPTHLLAEAAGSDMKVVFSGEGGDEVFAGYGRYRTGRLERLLKSIVFPGTGGFRVRGDLRGALRSRLLGQHLQDVGLDWRAELKRSWASYPANWSALQKMQALDLQHALPNNLLVKADRMLMSQGVEGRMPFVDRRVVAFGFHLQDRIKNDAHSGKKILKQWAREFMPADHFTASKRGFYVPIRDWWRGERLDRLLRVLCADPAVTRWFMPAGIKALGDRQRSRGDAARYLMSVLQFAIWHRLFIDGDGKKPPPSIDPLDFLDSASG